MAAPHSVDPAQLLEQHLADASPDLLREMIASFANAMMSAQADQACGAGYGERSAERTNQRNGYRAREWDTRAGTVELAVPKLAGDPVRALHQPRTGWRPQVGHAIRQVRCDLGATPGLASGHTPAECS